MAIGKGRQVAAVGEEVGIELNGVSLAGTLALPDHPIGIAIFAHGSGSSRKSPRNNFVADVLHDAGIGTFLFDLLTPEEDVDYPLRFDIGLLTERLVSTTQWLHAQPSAKDLPLGYFGASTGAAAALNGAAQLGSTAIRAVVSRGGRPDLAMSALPEVSAATLLIVGGDDVGVLTLNHQALQQLGSAHKKLIVVPGATHLFEEPGALEAVAAASRDWFSEFFQK